MQLTISAAMFTIHTNMVDKDAIRRHAIELIAAANPGVAGKLARTFGLSRQMAHRYLQELVRSGLVVATGNTRARIYRLATTHDAQRTYARKGLREDIVMREVFAPALSGLPEHVRDIWAYGVTEMVNNAIEHSAAGQVRVAVQRNALFADGWVVDDGVGIFTKIQQALGLYDPREALLELAKGKVTTDPAHHTGEGVFFTSRSFDLFLIRSGTLTFTHDESPLDVLVEDTPPARGTSVRLRLRHDSPRRLRAVFDAFTTPGEFTFSRTVVPVRLAQYEGEKLISRSQARRVALHFERFRQVVLDFAGVVEIGQAFADELFRVFAQAYPDVHLSPTNMTPDVELMVRRAGHREGIT